MWEASSSGCSGVNFTSAKPSACRTRTSLKRSAYAEELHELIRSTSIVAEFHKIQALVKDIKPTAILAAIGDAVGMKKLEVKQTATPARKPVDPNKPRKPRAVKTAKAS